MTFARLPNPVGVVFEREREREKEKKRKKERDGDDLLILVQETHHQKSHLRAKTRSLASLCLLLFTSMLLLWRRRRQRRCCRHLIQASNDNEPKPLHHPSGNKNLPLFFFSLSLFRVRATVKATCLSKLVAGCSSKQSMRSPAAKEKVAQRSNYPARSQRLILNFMCLQGSSASWLLLLLLCSHVNG